MSKNNLSIAIVNVDFLLQNGDHAQQVQVNIKEAQDIFQYNLDAIIKKLEAYTNKQQAHAYFMQAKNQLEAQFEHYKKAAIQSMLLVIKDAIETYNKDKKFSLILPKAQIILADESLEITNNIQEIYNTLAVTFPALPEKNDNPNLPEEQAV